MKLKGVLLSLVGVIGLTQSVSAVPIVGSIALKGSTTLNDPVPSAAGFDSISDATVAIGTQSGVYVGTGGTVVTTFNAFDFDPVLNPSPVLPLWEFDKAGLTYSFTLMTVDSVTRTVLGGGLYQLSVKGGGVASITGYDDTPGVFSITTTGDQVTKELGFASFTVVVPSPDRGSTVVLLGIVCLIGAVSLRYSGKAARSY